MNASRKVVTIRGIYEYKLFFSPRGNMCSDLVVRFTSSKRINPS